jgi:hypothetical protein
MQDEPEAGVRLAFAGAEVHNIVNQSRGGMFVPRLMPNAGIHVS